MRLLVSLVLLLLLCSAAEERTSTSADSIDYRVELKRDKRVELHVKKEDIFFEFNILVRGHHSWIGFGVSTSNGIGEIFMEPKRNGSKSSVVLGQINEINEYDLLSATKEGIVLHEKEASRAPVENCMLDKCKGEIGRCLASDLCKDAGRCIEPSTTISKEQVSNDTILRLSECFKKLEYEADGAYAFIQTVGCFVLRCQEIATEALEDQDEKIENATFVQYIDENTGEKISELSFTAKSRIGGVKFQSLIDANGNPATTFIWSHGESNVFEEHDSEDSGSITLNLLTGEHVRTPFPLFLYAHIILMFISFGILLPFGTIVHSLGIGQSWWHWVSQSMGVIFCFAGVVITSAFTVSRYSSAHLIVGSISISFTALTFIIAMCRPSSPRRILLAQNSMSWQIQIWSNLHILCAWCALCLGATNGILGDIQLSKVASHVSLFPGSVYLGYIMVSTVSFAFLVFMFSLIRSNCYSCKKNKNIPVEREFLMNIISPSSYVKGNIVEPMSLSFCNVSYTAISRKSMLKVIVKKSIIRGIHGSCPPKSLTCILGPSGCGKTTLLSLIGRRISHHSLEDITLNNRNIFKIAEYSRICGFCAQEDVFFPVLTVHEAFMFAAQLSIPDTLDDFEGNRTRSDRVNSVIQKLQLTHCARSYIGDGSRTNRGLSGGERRRVSIGLQLIHSPSLLLLDEPTSGLDSSSASQVMDLLREMANEGRTILASIHQPSTYIYELFDQILLMSAGEMVFFGPRIGAAMFFKDCLYPVPPSWSPCDWYISLINVVRSKEVDDEELPSSSPSLETKVVWETIPSAGASEASGPGVLMKTTTTTTTTVVQENEQQVDLSSNDILTKRMKAFYTKHNPEKLDQIEQLINYTRHSGIQALNQKLYTTYGETIATDNLPDIFLKNVTSTFEGKSLSIDKFTELVAKFRKSSYFDELLKTLNSREISLASNEQIKGNEYHRGSFSQIYLLLNRNLLVSWRVPDALKFQMIQNLILGVILGSLYSKSGVGASRAYQISFALLNIIGIATLTTISVSSSYAFMEKQVYLREKFDSLYSPWAFFFARLLVGIPINFAVSTALVLVAYFWVGLKATPQAFFYFFLLLNVNMSLFEAVSYLGALIAKTETQAYSMVNFYAGISLFFSGVVIQYPAIPVFYSWLFWISPIHYAYMGASVNEFEDTTESWWLDAIGLPYQSKIGAILVLIFMSLFFRVVGYLVLKRISLSSTIITTT